MAHLGMGASSSAISTFNSAAAFASCAAEVCSTDDDVGLAKGFNLERNPRFSSAETVLAVWMEAMARVRMGATEALEDARRTAVRAVRVCCMANGLWNEWWWRPPDLNTTTLRSLASVTAAGGSEQTIFKPPTFFFLCFACLPALLHKGHCIVKLHCHSPPPFSQSSPSSRLSRRSAFPESHFFF